MRTISTPPLSVEEAMCKNRTWLALVAAIAALGTLSGCTLDDAAPPEISGPSELATSIEMRAIPDQLVADGFSSSVIEAVVRDVNGQRDSGVTVVFDLTSPGAGVFFDLGNLSPLNGPRPTAGGVEAGPVSSVSDGDGVARARYWAPFRTDQENDTVVTVTGRPLGTDFNAAVFRSAQIFLRAANRPSFPGADTCAFIVEPEKLLYKVGEPIAFTATQATGANGNPIARYEWLFDDLTTKVGRDVVHAFATPGTHLIFLVTHESVTGARETCDTSLDVVP